MPTFAPPSTSSDNGSSQYERSFRTAGEITEPELVAMANSSDDRMETERVMNGRERSLMEQMNMMQQNYEQQMNLMKAEIISIKAHTPQQNTQPSTQGPQVNVESEKKGSP
ncbi:hypothetical protein K3495_g14730 [Podosphaera aphanis]|nr:hypothetical protein K3495_g14730 [Podosphaera aphanis]